MNFSVLVILFFSVVISGSIVFFIDLKKNLLKLILSFSGAYLLAITMLHLLPEAYASENNTKVGMYILLGFLLQIVLEFFSNGIEHGHVHAHKTGLPIGMMISLSIHSFIEGIPLYSNISATQNQQINSLLTAILLHNIPVSIALTSVLLKSGLKKTNSFLLLFLFALVTPIGALTGHVFPNPTIIINNLGNITALVIGIFLHISTTILFESSENHKFNLLKLFLIALSITIAIITL